MSDTLTPFGIQYPNYSNAELARVLRDVAAHPQRYGPADTARLLRTVADRLDGVT